MLILNKSANNVHHQTKTAPQFWSVELKRYFSGNIFSMIRRLFLGVVCFVFLTGIAQAEISPEDWKQLAILEGGIVVSSYIMASDPKEWGTFFVATSPLLAGIGSQGEFSWPKYAMGIAIIGGIGAWLISQEDENEGDITKKMVIGYNALFLPLWAMSKSNKNAESLEEKKVAFRWEPQSNQALVTYTIRF